MRHIRAAARNLENGKARYGREDLENLLAELRGLIDVIETAKAGGGTAADSTVLEVGQGGRRRCAIKDTSIRN